jgi:hypothetical protein
MSLLAPGASAQRVSFGVVVGGYANRDFDSQYSPTPPGFLPITTQSDSGGYVIGPSIDVRLFPRLSLGVEALYKPLRYSASASFDQNGAVIGYAPAPVVTWQFPVLAKYRFSLGRVRPFLEAGPSFRTAGNLNSADPSHFGVTAGVGVETEWRRLRIAPRVRYTRWAEDPWYAVRTRSDQLEFLVGISYASVSDAHPLGRRISFGAVIGPDVSGGSRTATYTWIDPSTGTPTTIRTSSGPGRLVVGPLVELSLSPRFSIEGNAISHSYRSATRVVGGREDSSSWAAPWVFPVLVKYRLATGSWRPFLALGPSFRLPKESGGAWLSNYGATAGAGVEIRLKRLKIAPAVRYTHWGPGRPRVAGADVTSGVSRSQMHVLVGVSF